MSFFQELAPLIEGMPVTMRLMAVNGRITLEILPDEIEKLEALRVTGTGEELDAELMNTIRQPLTDTKAMSTNLKEYGEKLQVAIKEKKEELDEEAKPQVKKVTAPVAKKSVSKPAATNKKAPPKPAAGKGAKPAAKPAPPKSGGKKVGAKRTDVRDVDTNEWEKDDQRADPETKSGYVAPEPPAEVKKKEPEPLSFL